MSSLQFHFLQTLEHRTDVSVTSTSLSGRLQRSRECPEHWLELCSMWSVLGPPPQVSTLVPCILLSRCQPCTEAGLCQWCPSREGVLDTTWSLKPPQCSSVPSPPSLSQSHWGQKRGFVAHSPAELCPGEGGPLLTCLEQKGGWWFDVLALLKPCVSQPQPSVSQN